MPREYRNIKQYEKEIFELKEQGLSQRQIGERLVNYMKMIIAFAVVQDPRYLENYGRYLKTKGTPLNISKHE